MKIIGIFLITCSLSFAQLVGPKISMQQIEYDFGTVEQGTLVKHSFIITNNGGDVLIIKHVKASCGCTAADPEKKELKPGESTNINVQFNTNGRSGKQRKSVYVETNDPGNEKLELKIYGTVIQKMKESVGSNQPKIYFDESQHDFGMVKEGNVVDYTFKFTNKGDAPLEIKDVQTSCGCTAALVSSKTVGPGQEGTLKVELNTKDRTGKMSRVITISSNDPEEPSKVLSISADVEKEIN
ncbi:MAG TPA: DUF1573 domain-containing protein [Ignavibacteriaceae bacterium]|nr:DUF1573 domain-containing protein [Ignavibacteriaceae bacterium]